MAIVCGSLFTDFSHYIEIISHLDLPGSDVYPPIPIELQLYNSYNSISYSEPRLLTIEECIRANIVFFVVVFLLFLILF